jgi:hypothetical protein
MSKPRCMGNNARAHVREADRILAQASEALKQALEEMNSGSLLKVGRLTGLAFGAVNLARLAIRQAERGDE